MAEAQIAHEELQKLVDTPVGPLRVNMPADFGTDFLAESFMEFSLRYPDVTFYLDLANPDHAQRVFQTCDVSIEIGELPDSTQIARLLGMLPAYLYASREYLEKHGEPKHPSDLTRHECIEFRAEGAGRHALAAEQRRPAHRVHARQPLFGQRRRHGAPAGDAGRGHRGAGRRPARETAFGPAVAGAARLAAGALPVYAVTETRLLPAKTRIFIEFLMERLGSGPTKR